MQQFFIRKIEKQVEINTVSFWTLFVANRWFGVVLEGYTAVQTTTIVLLCVFLAPQLGPTVASLHFAIHDQFILFIYSFLYFALKKKKKKKGGGGSVHTYHSMIIFLLLTDPVCTKYKYKYEYKHKHKHKYKIKGISVEAETYLVSIERLDHFRNMPQEPPHHIPEKTPKEGWPAEGKVEISHLSLRYRKDLPWILKDVNCSIKSGEKIGICGRTGSTSIYIYVYTYTNNVYTFFFFFSSPFFLLRAGKSSVMVALTRLFEAEREYVLEDNTPPLKCRILVDDVDILELGLFDVRSHLAIIPQSPILFSGTLRFNLDPFQEHSDEDLWEALKKVFLYDYITGKKDWELEQKLQSKESASTSITSDTQQAKKENNTLVRSKSRLVGRGDLGLNYPVSENGSNFSQGQKQVCTCLFCVNMLGFAAFLFAEKIRVVVLFEFMLSLIFLLLDEATSSVDNEIDTLIQKSIRANFEHCTILTIAHRLDTILDSDRIIVMSQGEIVEFDSPKALTEKPDGVFSKLLHSKDT
ncbi:hypothetical protein RFI_06484 [Reticulomyxa filosa]|uniref:ABC transporter domain-containing protein n=1 Tax=Reticulomyxa filosa TaxID=46433 RepID=X6NXT2_RETFI|nr:hypothetical protein RFI_06484 [Reticulomyxa filosa]|eukprot:ETO30634.1 hypothetical protein RFI_06484 [Reticulomyxa filosa]